MPCKPSRIKYVVRPYNDNNARLNGVPGQTASRAATAFSPDGFRRGGKMPALSSPPRSTLVLVTLDRFRPPAPGVEPGKSLVARRHPAASWMGACRQGVTAPVGCKPPGLEGRPRYDRPRRMAGPRCFV